MSTSMTNEEYYQHLDECSRNIATSQTNISDLERLKEAQVSAAMAASNALKKLTSAKFVEFLVETKDPWGLLAIVK